MSWRVGLAKFATSVFMISLFSAVAIVSSPMASATTSIGQASPTAGSIDVAGSNSFSSPLQATAGTYTGTVTFSASPNVSMPNPGIEVNNAGTAIVTSGTLAVGSYSLSGSDSDGSDTGTWSYTLTVSSDPITQGSPISGTTTVANSAAFTDSLNASPGFTDTIDYVSSGPSTPEGLEVSSSGGVTTTGTLPATTYSIAGTDSDAYGDTGTWSFSLTVTSGGHRTTITQTSPTTQTVPTTSSGTFTDGPITVENNSGTVTFVTTKSTPSLTVSSSGVIATTGVLTTGTYTVSGTDTDEFGDSGTWTYTLIVTGVVVTVTFEGNGGTGVMAPESESVPTALSLNVFTWARHTFVDWNTAANGSGISYANGAVFPFSATTTLFAQWKAGKAPSHTIRFISNGGFGTTPSEVDNTPTAILPNRFTRPGYTFTNWNSVANGSGETFSSGETYSFKKSIVLYAQWKEVLVSHVVTFVANGGVGAMSPETHRGPAKLTPNRFKRSGYTFIGWNTSASGSGASFANGATYSFSSSTTLYARWKKVQKSAPPPPAPSGVVIRPFAPKISTLSPILEGLIQNLASTVKSKGDKSIALFGYGDKLTESDERNKTLVTANVELGRMRAQAVATYLGGQLSALGLKGWTISISASTTSQYESATVIATLS